MTTQIQRRRGTTAQHSTFTGAEAELTVDTTKDTVVVHDGSTVGGRPLLREDQSNLPTSAPTTGIYNASGSLAISTNGTGRLFVNDTGRIDCVRYGIPSVIQSQRSDGTSASPSAISSSVELGRYSFLGYDGATHKNIGWLTGFSDGAITNSSSPGFVAIATTPSGSVTPQERLRVTSTGLVGVGTSSPGYTFQVQSGFGITTDGVTGETRLIAKDPNSNFYKFFSFYTQGANYAERMRIDDQGRVGIGTTNPGGYSGQLVVNVSPSGDHLVFSDDTTSSGAAAARLGCSGNNLVFKTNSGASAATERARIDSSGRLLVGTSSPLGEFAFQASNSSKIDLVVSNAASFTGGTNQESRVVLGKTESNAVTPMGIISARPEDPTSGAHGILTFSTRSNGTVSERMRIRADGRTTVAGIMSGLAADTNIDATFRVGATTATGTAMATYSYNDYKACSFIREAAGVGYERGSITVNNSSTAYNTSSDYRLKENVEPVTDGIARLQQLKPSRFNFIADPDNTVDGFIAHEVQDVVPEAIHGQKDAVDADGNPIYQGIDQSKLVPLLTAALQEAVAKIESLEARLTAAGI